jgi:predicted transcriptional regulator
MTQSDGGSKAETVTFRIDSALKTALAEIAERESKPLGELLRELIRERVEQKRRAEFEADARRQSLEAAAAAHDSNSDEAAVLRELDADLQEFAGEWK